MDPVYQMFKTHVMRQYTDYRIAEEQVPDLHHFLEYLVHHNLIYEEAIRHFTLLAEYDSCKERGIYKNKTQTVHELARRFHMHENSIWNLLKDHKRKFHRKTSIQLIHPRRNIDDFPAY